MKKITFFLILSLSFPLYAGMQKDLHKFFESVGYKNNITSANSFQDQKGGYYSGGSMVMRSKNETASVFSFAPPSIHTSCGNLDLYGGAFSFINKEQFLSLISDIGKKSLGFGISIALQSASPQIKSAIDQLMGSLQHANELMLDSCGISANMIGGLLPKTEATSQVLCTEIGKANNKFSDYASARQECGKNKKSAEINKNKPKEFEDIVGNEVNLVWKAIEKNPMFKANSELAELFMSISGTFVTKLKGEVKSTDYLPSLANDGLIAALIEGGKANVYKCDKKGADECLNPKLTEIAVKKENGFLFMVDRYLSSLVDKVKLNGVIDEEEKGFVNSTQFPVLKIIAVQTAFKGNNSPLSVKDLSTAIAYDIVLRYLSRTVELTSYAVGQLKAVQITDTDFSEFSQKVREVKRSLHEKRQGVYHQIHTTLAVIERTKGIENQLHSTFAQGELL